MSKCIFLILMFPFLAFALPNTGCFLKSNGFFQPASYIGKIQGDRVGIFSSEDRCSEALRDTVKNGRSCQKVNNKVEIKNEDKKYNSWFECLQNL